MIGERVDAVGAGLITLDAPGAMEPSVVWLDVGERLVVTTFGSSTCPDAPTGMTVDSDVLRIALSTTGGSACTEDLAANSYVLDLPAGLRGRTAVDVVLDLPDGNDVRLRLTG